MNIVYFNGHFIQKQDATISIMDRGFLFGDSIYEVVPIHNGKLIGGRQHFKRMQASLDALLLDCPFTDYAEFISICQQLLSENNLSGQNCALYFQITRGAEEFRFHRIPQDINPTIVAFCMAFKPKSIAELEKGFKAITHNDLRRDTNYIKSNSLLTNVMLFEKGRELGALETILLRNGKVLECTSSNLFIVKDNVIKTPPLSATILAGVTRSLILEFAHEQEITAIETDISEDELDNADEIWVTGSTKEICPIVQLNDNPVGEGSVGPMWHRINTLYQQFKEDCT